MIIRTYSLVPKVRREGAGDEATKPNDMTTFEPKPHSMKYEP